MSVKKLVIGGASLLALALGALTGLGASALPGSSGSVPVAHASGCDDFPPPPSLDCPATPTPTPPPDH